jgi:hypothetical protein
MSTIMRVESYRFLFYVVERDEPPHVHVERGEHRAKFWLAPVSLQYYSGFAPNEVNRILALIEESREALLRGWNERFGECGLPERG